MSRVQHHFEPQRHERQLLAILREIDAAPSLDPKRLDRIVRRYPKDGGGAFSKSEILRAYRFFKDRHVFASDESSFAGKLRRKPIRTASGVAPVTVLTKPYPCPGECIFCPNDVRMPKSYLAREPGAQRAAQHRFDPFAQTMARLVAFHHTGHEVDKVELIILGGTWSFYPEPYQIWFVMRCFEAMNDFDRERACELSADLVPGPIDFAELDEEVDGSRFERTYNQVVGGFLRRRLDGRLSEVSEAASWDELAARQQANENAAARCVGLVVETRPDHVSAEEIVRIRRLGATKVQLGIQSLSDEVLAKNRRGHDTHATRSAMALLRQAGFKLHVHWMPNLLGSDPRADVADFRRLFEDPALRPDELKIYPCSLIETAELMQRFEDGSWRPYTGEELLEVLAACLPEVPPYCRVTRVIRDIPGDEIVEGNKLTNFREIVERELKRRGQKSRDIRAREIRAAAVDPGQLRLERLEYESSTGREVFFQWIHPAGASAAGGPASQDGGEERLVGFCRLALPREESFLDELAAAAVIREVHVYGVVVAIGAGGGGRAQHLGLGRALVDEAARVAGERGYRRLAVISSVGTREYYRRLGFVDGELYQHRVLDQVVR